MLSVIAFGTLALLVLMLVAFAVFLAAVTATDKRAKPIELGYDKGSGGTGIEGQLTK